MDNRTRLLILVATCMAAMSIAAYRSPQFDLLVRNGTVIDGSGAKSIKADVAVKDG